MKAERWPANALIAVFGATGTGKSKLAVSLAKRFGGEIINADAVQMYEGLPIVTNKISVEEMAGVKHHLLGTIGLSIPPWTVRQYLTKALAIIEEIRSRGKLPILVGGTHYYTQSLLFQDQTINNGNQDFLLAEEQAEKWPILRESDSQILQKLREVDPDMAARWHPNDSRKIRRSLEIWLQTGRKASEIYAEQKQRPGNVAPLDEDETASDEPDSLSRYNTLSFWTHVNDDQLKERLNLRLDAMMEGGLLGEVQQMRDVCNDLLAKERNPDLSSGIWIAIGYKEFLEYMDMLESGTASEAELKACLANCVERAKAATRQYAKRQVRWIKLKLIPTFQLATSEYEGLRIFPLDASDERDWVARVEDPATRITESFLEGGSPSKDLLPSPELIDLTTNQRKPGNERLPQAKTCEICGVVMVTVSGEQQHMSSRRHKTKLRKLEKAAERQRDRPES